ncbi:MAG: hypothetical protein ABSC13_02970 [Dehalococcoidia bacterium]
MPRIVEALADCLEAMRQGEDMEICLVMYPQYRTELTALLQIASLLRPLPPEIAPSFAFKERTKVQILEGRRGQEGSSLAPDQRPGKFR